MKYLKCIVPLLAALFFVSCSAGIGSSDLSNDDVNDTTARDGELAVAPVQGTDVQLKDDALNAVYQQYRKLTIALTEGNTSGAKVASNAIEVGARRVDGGARLGSAAARITAASNIKEQRKAYFGLSTEMIALIKKAGVAKGVLYIDHCPMAFGEEGASWISPHEEIRNPYLGDEMLECGEVQETIKE